MTTTRETAAESTPTKKLRMAMVGIGVGGAEILPAMESTDGIELFAGADITPVTRERFQQRYPTTRVYPSIEALCSDPGPRVRTSTTATSDPWRATMSSSRCPRRTFCPRMVKPLATR